MLQVERKYEAALNSSRVNTEMLHMLKYCWQLWICKSLCLALQKTCVRSHCALPRKVSERVTSLW